MGVAMTGVFVGAVFYRPVQDWLDQTNRLNQAGESVPYQAFIDRENEEMLDQTADLLAQEPSKEEKKEASETEEGLRKQDQENLQVPAVKDEKDAGNDILPAQIQLAVPFTSQAPFGTWDEVHEETCEEASVYMVAQYYGGTVLGGTDPAKADKALLDMVDFQRKRFGFFESTTVAQVRIMAQEHLGLSGKILTQPTVEEIKKELALGHPVIFPLAGQEIGNPFFSGDGPIYHMLVVRGYTADGHWITNDPGTRRGEAYQYAFNTLMNALHDFPGKEADIHTGAPAVLVLTPSL